MSDSKGNTQRLIFTDMELTQKEQQHWDAFITHCETNKLEIPEQYKGPEKLMLRYLQATKFNYDKAHAAILNHQKWTVETKPSVYPGD